MGQMSYCWTYINQLYGYIYTNKLYSLYVIVFITYNGIVSLDRLKILIEKKIKLNNKHHIDFLFICNVVLEIISP